MDFLTGKKVLVILTNEAFLPKSGRGGRRLTADGVTPMYKEDGAVIAGSPSTWIAPNTTIMDPPATYASIQDTEETWTRGHERTGVDVYELGYLWMKLRREFKMNMIFATPRGGPVAADPVSVERMEKDSKLRDELREERDFITKMGHTLPISWVKPEEFKLVILLGGHGALFDLPEHEDVACAVAEVYRKNGYVAAIGHGVAGLINVRMERRGDYLVKNKKICCFSREEERKMGYENYLPFILEDKLKERGAKIENKKPFESNVITEERLITAQNPNSIHEFVNKITETARR